MRENVVAEGREETDGAAPAPPAASPDAARAADGHPIPARPLPMCPLCGEQLVTPADRCGSCAGDVRPLMRVVQMADQYFNRALVAARQKRWWEAAELLAVTLALREDDVEALVLLAKVRKHGKQHDLAKQAWQEALRQAPDREDVHRALDRSSRPAARSRNKERRTSP